MTLIEMRESENAVTVPKGWRRVRLGEVCELSKGRTPREEWYSTSGVWLVRFRDVSSSGVNWIAGFRTFVDETYSGELKELKPGTVLVTADAHDPKSIGKKICLISSIPPHASPTYYSGELLGIMPKSGGELVPEMVLYWLQSEDGYQEIQEYVDGVHLNVGRAKDMKIPLPLTLAEQERIARILNEQMSAVEKARVAAEARLEAARALPAAYLRAVFSSEQARDWPKKRIVEICTVRGGKRLPKGTDFAHTKTKFPYIRVVDFEKGNINLHGLKYLEEETYSQISRYIINRNDVYLSIVGTIGVAGIIPDALDGANLTENAARLIIMDKSNLFRDYLARFLQSRAGQDSIKQRTNAVGQPKLALERIETIEIPVPLISRQRELAHELDNQLSEANYLIKTLEQELEAVNALRAALLRRAFTGGL